MRLKSKSFMLNFFIKSKTLARIPVFDYYTLALAVSAVTNCFVVTVGNGRGQQLQIDFVGNSRDHNVKDKATKLQKTVFTNCLFKKVRYCSVLRYFCLCVVII